MGLMLKRYLISIMTKMMNKLLEQYKSPYYNQYVAPYRYCFFNSEGKKLGRIIWENNVDGIYIDKCDSEWGL